MSDTFNCPTCRKNFAKTAISCPKCGHLITQLDLDKAVKSDKYARIAAMVIMLPIFTWMVWPDGPEDLLIKQQAREQAAKTKAADKRKGFHCLSSWNGSHIDTETLIQETSNWSLNDYEHLKTVVAPKADNGMHGFYVTYRYKNHYDNWVVNEANGLYRNSDCEITEIVIDGVTYS